MASLTSRPCGVDTAPHFPVARQTLFRQTIEVVHKVPVPAYLDSRIPQTPRTGLGGLLVGLAISPGASTFPCRLRGVQRLTASNPSTGLWGVVPTFHQVAGTVPRTRLLCCVEQRKQFAIVARIIHTGALLHDGLHLSLARLRIKCGKSRHDGSPAQGDHPGMSYRYPLELRFRLISPEARPFLGCFFTGSL